MDDAAQATRAVPVLEHETSASIVRRMRRFDVLGPAAIVGLVCLAALAIKLHSYGGNPTGFVQFGSKAAAIVHPPKGAYVLQGSIGYDGQFYYDLAAHPEISADVRQAFGQAEYRVQRIAYPAIAAAAAIGRRDVLPWTLLAVNLLAAVALTLAMGQWSKGVGRSGGGRWRSVGAGGAAVFAARSHRCRWTRSSGRRTCFVGGGTLATRFDRAGHRRAQPRNGFACPRGDRVRRSKTSSGGRPRPRRRVGAGGSVPRLCRLGNLRHVSVRGNSASDDGARIALAAAWRRAGGTTGPARTPVAGTCRVGPGICRSHGGGSDRRPGAGGPQP